LTPWAKFNQIYPELNVPVGNRSVRASSRRGDGSRLGWEQETRLGARAWPPGGGEGSPSPASLAPSLGTQRAEPGPGSTDSRSAGIRQRRDFLCQREKIRGDVRHVKGLTAAAAGAVAGASGQLYLSEAQQLVRAVSEPAACLFFFW